MSRENHVPGSLFILIGIKKGEGMEKTTYKWSAYLKFVAFSLLGYDETVYHNADRALYTTKENNRSGCTIFEEMKK